MAAFMRMRKFTDQFPAKRDQSVNQRGTLNFLTLGQYTLLALLRHNTENLQVKHTRIAT